jgi:site-specific DNA-methyltransferase (adenine-specific)
MRTLPRNTILTGDAATWLRQLPEASVDCVVTSPPYYGLRDYGEAGQLGLEPSVEQWVEKLRTVAYEIGRVLKPSGAFWLNLGDSFSRHAGYGAPPKALLLAPERLVLALAEDGWRVRNRVVWAKTNPMPSQVRDRLALTWEVLYLLVRSKSYYFDLDTIREPHTSRAPRNSQGQLEPAGSWAGPLAATRGGLAKTKLAGRVGHPLGKNPGDVWRIATRGFTGAHFATFPPELVRRPILATCPALVCTHCGLPRRSTSEHRPMGPSCDVQAATRPGGGLDPF